MSLSKLISGWGVINSHDWNRCSLKEEGYHTIYISNYLILNLSYLWTTSYDRSLLNWTIRAKWKNKTELFGECLVWTQKMSLFVLFCSCCVSPRFGFEMKKAKQPWAFLHEYCQPISEKQKTQCVFSWFLRLFKSKKQT